NNGGNSRLPKTWMSYRCGKPLLGTTVFFLRSPRRGGSPDPLWPSAARQCGFGRVDHENRLYKSREHSPQAPFCFKLAPLLSNSRNQRFHLRLCDRRIHASELETLPAADPGMTDDCNPAIKQALPQRCVKAVFIGPSTHGNITENHRAETGSVDELQCRRTTHRTRGMNRQFHGAVDHPTQLPASQHLKSKPQLEHIEAAGGEQRIRHQVGDALFFMGLWIQVVSVQFDELEVTSVAHQESGGRDGLPEEL